MVFMYGIWTRLIEDIGLDFSLHTSYEVYGYERAHAPILTISTRIPLADVLAACLLVAVVSFCLKRRKKQTRRRSRSMSGRKGRSREGSGSRRKSFTTGKTLGGGKRTGAGWV